MPGKQRILVVDDTPSNIKILNDILKDDYLVSFAINGPDALTLAVSKNRPDLILLDIMMPEMDGYEVCRKLQKKKATAGIPVIFVTAMTEEEDEARGFDAGCVDYITKPVSPPVVLARIKTHLDLKNARARAERLLSKTLLGSVRVLADVMSFVDPYHFNQSTRLKRVCSKIGKKLNLGNLWQLEVAATLSQLGKISAPEEAIKKIQSCRLLTEREQKLMKTYAGTGKELLTHIPSMGEVAEIIGRQHDPLPAKPIKEWDYVTVCSQIIKLVCAYDHLLNCGQAPAEAIQTLENKLDVYDQKLVGLLKQIELSGKGGITKTIEVSRLSLGMVLMEDLLCDDGVVLIKKYTELSNETIHLIKKNMRIRNVMSAVRVIDPS